MHDDVSYYYDDRPRDRTKSKFSLFDKISKPLANEPKKEGSDKEAAEKERVDKNRKQQERKEKKEKKERDKKEKKDKKDKERADKKAKETPVKYVMLDRFNSIFRCITVRRFPSITPFLQGNNNQRVSVVS